MSEASTKQFTLKQAFAPISNIEVFLGKLMAISSEEHVRIVCLDANNVAGRAHVETAVYHAMRAFLNHSNIADSLEMETLLYAAGTRQCSVASGFGIHRGDNWLYICIIPPSDRAERLLKKLVVFNNENWEEVNQEKLNRLMRLFSVTQAEIEVVGFDKLRDLVIERVALLDAMK